MSTASPPPAVATISAPARPPCSRRRPTSARDDRGEFSTREDAGTRDVTASRGDAGPCGEGRRVTTAQIVARSDPSVALVKGAGSSGTGFLVKPGVIATNAHVIDGEFISALEVQFPSAPQASKARSTPNCCTRTPGVTWLF